MLLPRRAAPALDKAIILASYSPAGMEEGRGDEDGEDGGRGRQQNLGYGATMWSDLGVAVDKRPVVVRREDGFEKRRLLRCGRCRLVWGYRLEDARYDGAAEEGLDVVYVLPGAMVTTEEMKRGVVPAKEDWEREVS